MKASWADALVELLGSAVQFDPDVVASMSRDQALLAPAGIASALVRARSIDDVVKTLRFANERGIPVVTRGAGTGLAGGANAVDGAILLSVAALDRILRVDPATRTAVVEPGVLNGVLAARVAQDGLYYAPDPASRDISTLGGNVATNAGGACCLKYGVTGDHVAALKVALADGSVIATGAATKKNVAGLDLTRLMVGSEGTLGVTVGITLRPPKRPRPPATMVAFFDSLDAAGHAIVAMDAVADLSLVEVMDRTTVAAVERMAHMELDTSAEALLLVQSDAVDAASDIAACEEVCRQHGARSAIRTDDPEEGKLLLTARRLAFPALERLGSTLLDDVAVPKPAIPEMMRRIPRIAAEHGLVIGTFGHAGDGNLHPTIVFDEKDPASQAAAYRAFDAILMAALELGGTITGEHGVGSLKRAYVGRMVGDVERALMARVKAAFDPKGILNPGKGI